MSTVKLLHISDLHISKWPDLPGFLRKPDHHHLADISRGSYAPSHSLGKLRAVVGLANEISSDAIVLTGDIATTGTDPDLEKALQFIEGPPYLGGQYVPAGYPNISQHKIFLLPGNHDRYKLLWKRAGFAPGSRNFHRVFNQYWTNDVKTYAILNTDFAVAIIAADLSLRRGLDSKFPQLPNAYAQGKVYRDILADLERETTSFQALHEEQDLCIIWAVHFPPVFPQITTGMRLIDDNELRESANRNGVSLILSGHTHNPFEFSSPVMRFRVLCAGTASQSESPEGNYCQLLSIENLKEGCSISVTHYRFDQSRVRFVPA